MSSRAPIYVTRPQLPPLDDFVESLRQIWDSRILTNGGPFHQKLEAALCAYLGVEHISLFNNGTSALLTAMQALGLSGEVITTPYTFVATSHSLLWSRLTPVFVDVDPLTLNLDPARIEAAITPATSAILPVHCYGHPCDTAGIGSIAVKHGLKVLYDAAHAFGVQAAGRSILRAGDLSVLSFHATKVFNTFEGGAIVSHDARTKEHIDHLKNFGFTDEVTVVAAGINGKMSEINAALGLLQLREIDHALEARRAIDALYRRRLRGIRGIDCLEAGGESRANYAYFPVLVRAGYKMSRDALFNQLRASGIVARRYFYPLVSEHPMYCHLPSAAPSNLAHAAQAAQEIICLPIYPELPLAEVERIAALLH